MLGQQMLEQNWGGSVAFIEVTLRTVSTFGSFLTFAHQKIIPNCTFAFMAYILKVIESLQKYTWFYTLFQFYPGCARIDVRFQMSLERFSTAVASQNVPTMIAFGDLIFSVIHKMLPSFTFPVQTDIFPMNIFIIWSSWQFEFLYNLQWWKCLIWCARRRFDAYF